MYDVIIIGGAYPARHPRGNFPIQDQSLCPGKRGGCLLRNIKANSAIVHAGYDAVPGSLMAKLNVKGNEMMEQLSKDLDFPFRRIGSLVICLNETDMPKLQELYEKGLKNGVRDLKIISGEEAKAMEPNLMIRSVRHFMRQQQGLSVRLN